MNRKTLLWAMALVVIVPAMIGVGYWLWWDLYAKYQPNLLKRDQETVQSLLDRSGYVSEGLSGPKLYIITHRDCKPCRVFEAEELPKYASVNVDSRVIVIAPSDDQGLPQSTPEERSTVAELWWSRDFKLYKQWFATPDSQWKAEGLAVADNDLARTAVVNAGRQFVVDLTSSLRANNVRMAYPMIIWRDKSNTLKACACADERSFAAVRADLGAPDRLGEESAPAAIKAIEEKVVKDFNSFDWSRLDPRQWFKSEKSQPKSNAPIPAGSETSVSDTVAQPEKSSDLQPALSVTAKDAATTVPLKAQPNPKGVSPVASKSTTASEVSYPEYEPVYGPE